MVQPTAVWEALDAGLVLWVAIIINNVLSLQLNPHKKIDVIGTDNLSFEAGVTPSATSLKPTLASRGYNPQAKYSSMESEPPMKPVDLTKAASPVSESGQLIGGSVRNSSALICERQE
jgi:hypothetical protein